MNRLFALLLLTYPRAVREELGAAMTETFEEEWAAVRAQGALPSLWFAFRNVVRTPLLGLEERVRTSVAAVPSGGWSVDVRHALGSVLRSPAFSLGTALTVGLGVGATVSIFTVVDATIIQDLPVLDPERLVRFAEDRDRYQSVGPEGPRIPVERYQTLRDALTGPVFTGFVGHAKRSVSIRADGPSFSARGALTTGNYFEVLGLRPAVGRFFSVDDEPSIVLGHRLWQSRFGGDHGVVGQSISISGRPFTVVGVAPADFASTIGFLHMDFFAPVEAHGGEGWPGARLALFGRLMPGLEPQAAEVRASSIVTRFPPEVDTGAQLRGAELAPMTSTPASEAKALTGFLAMLLGMAALVLLIAGANVAGLLLARAARRERETAVRLALGIGRARLVRQWMIEAVGLFAAGGLVGVAIAVAVGSWLSRISLPIEEGLVIDAWPGPRSVVLAIGLAVVAGLVFGILPAIHASRAQVASGLRDGGYGTSRRTSRTRRIFVTAQLSLSVVLLVAATLFVRTAHTSMAAEVGFNPENVMIAEVNLASHGYTEAEGRIFFDRLASSVVATPDIESASLASLTLMTGAISSYGGWRLDPDDDGVSVRMNRVDGSYFETMEIPIAAGRSIEASDAAGSPDVVVVNESFARRFWPDDDPLGKTILRVDRPYEVVGVVADGRYVDFDGATSAFAFLAIDQHYTPARTLHIKSRSETRATQLIQNLRSQVAALDPDVAVVQPMRLESAMAVLLFPQRFAATLIGVFGIIGLFLAATGVYGVLAHHVVRRSREFGVRIALGAKPKRLLVAVLRHAAILAAIGATIGLAISAGVSQLLSALLLGLDPFDPVAFLGIPLVLGVVALSAGLFPALRVLRLDPVKTLKQE